MQPRLFNLSGIVFVVLTLVAVVGVGGNTPGTNAQTDELTRFYGDNVTRQAAASFLAAAAIPFIVFFGIGLATSLGSPDGRMTAWGYVLTTGTTLVAGSAAIVAFTHFALANGGDENISGAALQALNSLDGNNWMVFNPAFGVMMIGAAGVLLTAATHRWLGWIAVVPGVAMFVPFADFFGLLATLAWIVVAAIVLTRAAPRANLLPSAGTA
jgi:hypothetical protein